MFIPRVGKLARRFAVLAVLVACLVTVAFQKETVASDSCCLDCKAEYEACCASWGGTYCPFECENVYYSCASGCSLECPMLPW